MTSRSQILLPSGSGFRSAVLLTALLSVLACEGRGCHACGAPYLAELSEQNHDVKRDFATSVGAWKACEPGTRFRLGDGLRTGASSTALLAMQPSGEVLVQENTTIRFEREQDGGERLEIETGSVEVETDTVDLQVHSAEGVTRIAARSRVTVRARKGRPTRVSVHAGRAVLERNGEKHILEEGQELELDVGAALIEEGSEAASDAGTDSAQDQPADGPGEIPRAGPYEVPIQAGETATVHDASPPTTLGFTLSCDEGGLVEVDRVGKRRSSVVARARGRTHASVRLPRGTYRYRVRCLRDGKPERRSRSAGRVRIVADAATRRLPAKAQRVSVDADGRNYRIQYENRLPRFTFSWRDAPSASGYLLVVERQGRAPIRKRSRTPRTVLREGALGEGVHRYHWEARGSAARSKTSTLLVTFENQGGTAYLARSLSRNSESGNFEISGGALARSRVSIDGNRVLLGPQGRFRAPVASGSGPVVVRVAHPANGVHYYVRKRSGAHTAGDGQ